MHEGTCSSSSAATQSQNNNRTDRQLYSRGSLQSGCSEVPLSFNRQLTPCPLWLPRGPPAREAGRGINWKVSAWKGNRRGRVDRSSRMRAVKTEGRVWAAWDQMECKAGAICHPQAIHWGGCSIFHWTGVCICNKGYKLRKPPRLLVRSLSKQLGTKWINSKFYKIRSRMFPPRSDPS